MKIYGVALLCACFLVGKYLGQQLGNLLGIPGDIGGVGFAMLLLMLGAAYLGRRGKLGPETASGIGFWSAMYIPIIVAMAATLNVKAAFGGGWVALLAGAGATLAGFMLVPILARIGRKDTEKRGN